MTSNPRQIGMVWDDVGWTGRGRASGDLMVCTAEGGGATRAWLVLLRDRGRKGFRILVSWEEGRWVRDESCDPGRAWGLQPSGGAGAGAGCRGAGLRNIIPGL